MGSVNCFIMLLMRLELEEHLEFNPLTTYTVNNLPMILGIPEKNLVYSLRMV